MAIGQREPIYKQIRNLLIILASGILCAVAFAGLFLHYYSPTGTYKLKNVMISPSAIDGLAQGCRSTATGKNPRIVIDTMDFSLWNATSRQSEHIPIDIEHYRRFYNLFADEMSIDRPTEEIVKLFHQKPPAELTIHSRTTGKDVLEKQSDFQVVQFAAGGDFYRLDLREQNAQVRWIYFYHPHVLEKVSALFEKAEALK